MSKDTNTELVPKEARREARASGMPSIGEWFWLKRANKKRDDDYDPAHGKFREELVCVERLRSNHVLVRWVGTGSEWDSLCQVRNENWFKDTRPAPEWERVITERMQQLRLQMDEKVKQLRNEAVAKNAIVDANATPPTFSAADAMLPAVRVVEPSKQKADFIALKAQLEVVNKEVGQLAKAYAGQAKMLQLSQRFSMEQTSRELDCLNDRIFVLEVYAGMQEAIVQIADGKSAPDGTKIAVRQSLLFMDEETLINYDGGGMDFGDIEEFDAWVVTPENLARILPESRGIVAFRVRRESKNYGRADDLLTAWAHMKWNERNMQTYLVIRNGEKVYRIASSVDFSPRLIPLRDEFGDAFTEEQTDWSKRGEHGGYGKTVREISPQDLDYDEKVEKLMERLRSYNKITILLQGLLDRSEVFQPIAPANLSTAHDFEHTLDLIRDEEDALPLTQETFDEYRDRLNANLKRGDWVYISYPDPEKRGYDQNERPDVLRVDRVRPGKANDVTLCRYYSDMSRRDHPAPFEDADEITGRMGVEVSWPWGTRHGYEHGDWGQWGEWTVSRRRRQWIPLENVFNMEGYQTGDFKVFLCDRAQKGQYLRWSRPLLAAERYQRGKFEFDDIQLNNPDLEKKNATVAKSN